MDEKEQAKITARLHKYRTANSNIFAPKKKKAASPAAKQPQTAMAGKPPSWLALPPDSAATFHRASEQTAAPTESEQAEKAEPTEAATETLPFSELEQTDEQKGAESKDRLAYDLKQAQGDANYWHTEHAELQAKYDKLSASHSEFRKEKNKEVRELQRQIDNYDLAEQGLTNRYETALKELRDECKNLKEKGASGSAASDLAFYRQTVNLNNLEIAKLKDEKENLEFQLRTEVDNLAHERVQYKDVMSGVDWPWDEDCEPPWLKNLMNENAYWKSSCKEFSKAAKEAEEQLENPDVDLGPDMTIRKIAKPKSRRKNNLATEQSDNELSREDSQTSHQSDVEQSAQNLLFEMDGDRLDDSASSRAGDDDDQEDGDKTLTNIDDTTGPVQNGESKAPQFELPKDHAFGFSPMVAVGTDPAQKGDKKEEPEKKPITYANVVVQTEKDEPKDEPKEEAEQKPIYYTNAAVQTEKDEPKDEAKKQALGFSAVITQETQPEDATIPTDSKTTLALQKLDEVFVTQNKDKTTEYFDSKPADERAKHLEQIFGFWEQSKQHNKGKYQQIGMLKKDLDRTKNELAALKMMDRESLDKEMFLQRNKKLGIGATQAPKATMQDQGVQTDTAPYAAVDDPSALIAVRTPIRRIALAYFIPLIIMLPLLISWMLDAYWAKQFWLTANDLTLSHLLDIQTNGDGVTFSEWLKPIIYAFIWIENRLEMRTILLG